MVDTSNPAYKHGHAARSGFSPEYHSWASMMTRCYNKKRAVWQYYGGRGIKVCKRWKKFENFLADMGPRPAGLTLDRRNAEGDYTPRNCRWATHTEQSRNRRKRDVGAVYSAAILRIVSALPTTMPELVAATVLHQETVKQCVRKLRAAGSIKTTRVPFAPNSRGRTLLCEFNGRN